MFDPRAVLARSGMSAADRTSTAVPQSLVLVFWAFTGLESASVAAAVVENPERNVPHRHRGRRVASPHSSIWRPARPSWAWRPPRISPLPRRRSRSWPRKMFGPVAGPLVAMRGHAEGAGDARRLGADDRAGESRRGGSWPVAADLRANARGRYAGRGAADRRARSAPSAIVLTISPTLSQQFGLPHRSVDVVRAAHVPGRLRGGTAYRLRGEYDAGGRRRRVLHLRDRAGPARRC